MSQILLLIIVVQCAVILVLLHHIFFPPKVEHSEQSSETPEVIKPKIGTSSIIGTSKAAMLELKPESKSRLKPKRAIVPQEELEDVFASNYINAESFECTYDQQENTELIEEQEPIFLEEASENIELQKKVCLDYMQIYAASKALVKGEEFTEDNIDTYKKLRGTQLMSAVIKSMNGKYSNAASDLIDNLELLNH